MGTITDIKIQKKNPNRVSIFIDGEFFVGMDLFTSQKHRLKIDQQINVDKLNEAVFDAECASAFEKSLGLINTRMRATSEIIVYLKEKLYSNEVIDSTIQKLESYRYIDDSEFCRVYIQNYKNRWGAKKIEFMLKSLKIDREIIAQSMSELDTQVDEAVCLLIRHTGKKEFDKNKAYTHLAQKGFKSDCIKQAIYIIENGESED